MPYWASEGALGYTAQLPGACYLCRAGRGLLALGDKTRERLLAAPIKYYVLQFAIRLGNERRDPPFGEPLRLAGSGSGLGGVGFLVFANLVIKVAVAHVRRYNSGRPEAVEDSVLLAPGQFGHCRVEPFLGLELGEAEFRQARFAGTGSALVFGDHGIHRGYDSVGVFLCENGVGVFGCGFRCLGGVGGFAGFPLGLLLRVQSCHDFRFLSLEGVWVGVITDYT